MTIKSVSKERNHPVIRMKIKTRHAAKAMLRALENMKADSLRCLGTACLLSCFLDFVAARVVVREVFVRGRRLLVK